MTTIIAKNQTAGALSLKQLPVPNNQLPASPAAVTLTDFASVAEIQADTELRAHIVAGDVVLNDGVSDLNTASSLQLTTVVATTTVLTDTRDSYAELWSDETGQLIDVITANVYVAWGGQQTGDVAGAPLMTTAGGVITVGADGGGFYDCEWETAVDGTNNVNVKGALFRNGTIVSESISVITMSGANTLRQLAGQCLIQLSPGDTIDLRFTTATATDPTVYTVNLRAKRRGITAAGASDDAAIHDNVAGEIAAVTLKVTPVSADLLLIEDSAAGNAKKRVTVGSLPGGGGGDNISVNGAPATDADFDNATPAAPAGGVNVKWQKDTSAPDNISAHLAANDVGNTVLSDMAANTVKANPTAGTADPQDLAVGTNTVLGRVAGNIVAAQLVDAQVAAATITNARLADMVQSTIKGRAVAAGTGVPTDLTATQATAVLDTFTDALKGLAPASGGGTANFLRADGTWNVPAKRWPYSKVITVDKTDADADYATIQAAVDAAAAGDTILIGPGSYDETLTISKNLTLRGFSRISTTIEPAAAALSSRTMVTVSGSAIVTLSNLAINMTGGGTGQTYRLLSCASTSQVTAFNCLMTMTGLSGSGANIRAVTVSSGSFVPTVSRITATGDDNDTAAIEMTGSSSCFVRQTEVIATGSDVRFTIIVNTTGLLRLVGSDVSGSNINRVSGNIQFWGASQVSGITGDTAANVTTISSTRGNDSFRETGGPTLLFPGAVSDGHLFRRSGTSMSGIARAGVDTSAVHTDVASEISALTEKVTPASTDFLIIEDAAAANVKKKVLVGNLPTAGGGEANSASNFGVGGVGVFHDKSGIDLRFRNINIAANAGLSVALDSPNREVDLSLDINSLTADATPEAAADYVATWDNSAGVHKKVLVRDIRRVFGDSFQIGTSLATQTETSSTYQLKFRYTTTSLAAGTYFVIASAELATSTSGRLGIFRFQENDVDLQEYLAISSVTPQFIEKTMHFSRVLGAGTHNYDFEIADDGSGPGATISIRNMRVVLWRVS